MQPHGPQRPEAPGAGSLIVGTQYFLLREEVAVQRRGVTAGAEVHRCLGAVGRLQRQREVLCAWSGDAVTLGHISRLATERTS